MKMKFLLSATAVAAMGSAQTLAQISIDVIPSLAPNGYGSPSYASWVANATYAIENGLGLYGDPGPDQYIALGGAVTYADITVTSFPSWRGNADPGNTFGPDYANELGTRLLFGLHITAAQGTQFSISQLSFEMGSTDPDNALGYAFGLGTYQYSSQYYGINYGGDGVKGGGDDTVITSGANTQLINELVGRGSGSAYWPVGGDQGPIINQQVIDADVLWLSQNYGNTEFWGEYTLSEYTGSASVNIEPVPEASTFIGGLALAGLLGRRLLRRK